MARTRRQPLFPVAADQLPRIHVSPEQHDELRAYMLPMVQEVVRDGPTWGRSSIRNAQREGWKIAASTPDACFLTKSSRRADHSSTKSSDKHAVGASSSSSMHSLPRTPGQCFMGSSLSPYPLEDVMSSVYCETTEELRTHLASTYGASCLDCCVLATLEGATLSDPFWYIGIKWVALRSPARRLVSSREFVYVEHSGSHVQRDGQRLLYRIFQSINIRAYGGQDSYFGLTRGHVEGAIVYWPDDARSTPAQPVLHVATKGRAHFKGSIPLWLAQMYLTRYWNTKRALHATDLGLPAGSVHHVGDENESGDEVAGLEPTRQQQLAEPLGATGRSSHASSGSREGGRKLSDGSSHSSSSAPLEMAMTWVPDDARSTCYVCQKRFQRVRRPKHHCRSCGEVICSDCMSYSKLAMRPELARKLAAESKRKLDVASRAAVAAGVGKPARTFDRTDSSGAVVIVGKVCDRCVELREIMHNNSAFLDLGPKPLATTQQPRAGRGSSSRGADSNETAVLTTLHPAREPSETLGLLSEEKTAAASSDCADVAASHEIVNRSGRQSSLSSSEVRAVIEERRSDVRSDSTRAASARTADSAPTINDVDNDDDDEEEVADDGASENLEFQPVLASGAAALEMLADAGNDYSSSLTSFDPDFLFDLHEAAAQQQQLLSEGLDSDDEMTSAATIQFATSQQQQSPEDAMRQRELLLAPLSPSTASASTQIASPSSAAAAVAAAIVPVKRGKRMSITDVKLAIADHAKLLDVIKREHDVQLGP